VWKIFLPGLFGLAVTQINTLLDSVLSVFRSEQAPTELSYANRLLQFPMGIFGVSLAAATLPALSKLRAAGKMIEFKKTFSYAVRQVFAVSIPSSIGLIVLAVPIYALLFEHGEFTPENTIIVARVMICYTIGLFAYSAVKVIVPAFLAMQDSKTPMKLGLIGTLTNFVLNITVMLTFPEAWNKYISAAFASTTAIAGVVFLAVLLISLRKRIGDIGGKEILSSFLRISASSLGMGVVTWLTLYFTRRIFQIKDLLSEFFIVLIPVAAGIISYAALAFALNVREFKETVSVFSRRMRRAQ
jgi:putative peptidoglycan lipid II flippase